MFVVIDPNLPQSEILSSEYIDVATRAATHYVEWRYGSRKQEFIPRDLKDIHVVERGEGPDVPVSKINFRKVRLFQLVIEDERGV